MSDAAGAAAVHAGLIVPSFPEHERTSAEEFVAAVAAGDARLWTAWLGERPVGCAYVARFPGPAWLLVWLAVGEAARGLGVGRTLVEAVRAGCAAEGVRLLVGEIEDPAGPASAAHGDPARRAAFYAGLGARALVLPHEQPPVGPGWSEVPLLLFALACAGELPAGGVPAEEVAGLLRAYRAGSPGWAAVAAALAAGPVEWGDLTHETFLRTRALARR